MTGQPDYTDPLTTTIVDALVLECTHTGPPSDTVPGGCPDCWELAVAVTERLLSDKSPLKQWAIQRKNSQLSYPSKHKAVLSAAASNKRGNPAQLMSRIATDWTPVP